MDKFNFGAVARQESASYEGQASFKSSGLKRVESSVQSSAVQIERTPLMDKFKVLHLEAGGPSPIAAAAGKENRPLTGKEFKNSFQGEEAKEGKSTGMSRQMEKLKIQQFLLEKRREETWQRALISLGLRPQLLQEMSREQI